ncbi:MAG: Membrane-bound lytic murein transglycosylase D [Candidatus Peregrinibacteria bacterium GW2011_GWA2_33_10]|nr:MAG: Membrane-bound lytic murein transglycosylase D [Candidatus Peregrinibacteria bacterium GW2011_GWA2_33_10]KKP41195.1 MAG: lytic transglycosylase, membrane-bound lytic murein transglycosylase D [Candidatus Peregrinibacteria bacterium GW2011_GWC2_33_13]OGJ50842.1 MAG: hypothetical protein A2229_05050 [Candidatus Peregrinibacteria bacterium RIFOXYA2_FULL_33_7]
MENNNHGETPNVMNRRYFLKLLGGAAAAMASSELLSCADEESCAPKIELYEDTEKFEKNLKLKSLLEIEKLEPKEPIVKNSIEVWENIYRNTDVNTIRSLPAYENEGTDPTTLYTSKGICYPIRNIKKLGIGGKLEEGIFLRFPLYINLIRKIYKEEGVPEWTLYNIFNESEFGQGVSGPGATGPWQFMSRTGNEYNLQSGHHPLIDERRDYLLAARASARYLKNLKRIFPCENENDSWLWAFIAYNQGPGNAKKYFNICKSEKNTDIVNYLSKVREEYSELAKSMDFNTSMGKIDKLKAEISKFEEQIKSAQKEKKSSRRDNKIKNFRTQIKNKEKILNPLIAQRNKVLVLLERLNYLTKFFGIIRVVTDYYKKHNVTDEIFDEKELEFDSISIKYKNLGENIVEVKSGDNLSTIAAKNGVKIDNLKAWNNLKNNTIRIGQKLKIELKPEQIELLDLIGKLYDSEEKRVEFFDELLFLNPAINLRNGLYDDIKNALINGNGSGLKISLPENYNLRLPKGLAPEILTIYANSLRELPEKDLIVEYRKQITEEAAIAQVTTETGSRARKLLEEFNINFDSSKAADSGLILELNRISGILDKELQTGVVETQEQYDEIKVAINEKREEIRILIAQTLKTGLEVDTSSDYLVKLNERYENADKENITELSEIITLYEKELEKAAKVSELQAQVVEKLNELQADLEKIIEKSVDEIVEGNYFETGAEFPAQLQEKLTIANDNAIRLSAYTNKNVVMSANAVQSINKITQEKEKAKVLKDRQIAAAEPKKETIKPAEAKTGKQDEKTVPETAAMKSVKRPESTSKKGITKKRGLKLKVKPGWDLKQLQICYNVTREELYKTNPKLHRLSLKDSREIIVPVDYIEHTVKQGEGFIRIAGDYGVTLTSIYNANYGVKDETLRPGQKLIIVLPKTPKKH